MSDNFISVGHICTTTRWASFIKSFGDKFCNFCYSDCKFFAHSYFGTFFSGYKQTLCKTLWYYYATRHWCCPICKLTIKVVRGEVFDIWLNSSQLSNWRAMLFTIPKTFQTSKNMNFINLSSRNLPHVESAYMICDTIINSIGYNR